MSGRVLREALAPSVLLTGFIVFGAMWLADWMIGKASPELPTSPVIQFMLALTLVRFALNGYFGEWGGTVLSTSGGSWYSVFGVTFRYLALTAIWLVPMIALKASPAQVGQAMGAAMLGMGSGKAMFLIALYVTLGVLTPPVFLIVSVGAASFGEIFSPAHWSRLFSGRKADLFGIYCLYTGGVTIFALLALPLVVLSGMKNADLGLFLAGGLGMYVGGFAVTLLGRLCGFFAAYEAPEEGTVGAEHEQPLDIGPVTPPDARPATLTVGSAGARARASADTIPLREAMPAPVRETMSAAMGEAPATEIRRRGPLPGEPVKPNLGLVTSAGGVKPPLLDARERVNAISGRFEQDPEATIRALEDLRDRFAEHPLVLHALCILKEKDGDIEGSFKVAGSAIPLFMARGNLRLAAEVFHVHMNRAADLGLDRDVILELANQLRQLRFFDSAARAYTLILEQDPTETKAIKGMLQVAEGHMHHHNDPGEARGIYQYLIRHCGSSPLAEFMHQGLTEAERRAAANG